jgi:hypothetical protein
MKEIEYTYTTNLDGDNKYWVNNNRYITHLTRAGIVYANGVEITRETGLYDIAQAERYCKARLAWYQSLPHTEQLEIIDRVKCRQKQSHP